MPPMLLKYPCSEQRPLGRIIPAVSAGAIGSISSGVVLGDRSKRTCNGGDGGDGPAPGVLLRSCGKLWIFSWTLFSIIDPKNLEWERERESKASEIISVGSLDRGFFHFPSLFGTCLGDESTWQRVGWCGQPLMADTAGSIKMADKVISWVYHWKYTDWCFFASPAIPFCTTTSEYYAVLLQSIMDPVCIDVFCWIPFLKKVSCILFLSTFA